MKSELNILMVEDSADDAELVQHALRRSGLPFRSRRVQSQASFLQAIAEDCPDVILSDHGLPAFDGFEALSIAQERCADVPFIFVTGAFGPDEKIESVAHGAAGYVLKDQLSKLAPMVQQAVRGARESTQYLNSTARGSAGLFRALVDSLRDYAICLLDESGRVITCDATTAWMKACRSDEIVGEHISRFYSAEGIALGQPALALTWAVTAGQFEEEALLVRKDQFPYWAHVIVTALLDQQERLRGFAFVARDITQLKMAEVG